MNLLDLLRAYGADDATIALAERWLGRAVADDGTVTWAEGTEPMTDVEVVELTGALALLADDDEATLGLLEAAANTIDDLRAESTRRDAEADAAALAIEEQRARIRGTDATAEGDDAAGDGEGDDAAGGDGGDAGDGADGGDGGDGGDGAGDGDGAAGGDAGADAGAAREAVTAAARGVSRAAIARRQRADTAPVVPGSPGATLTYAGDAGVAGPATVPATVVNLHNLDAALQRRAEAFSRAWSDGPGGVHMIPVATLATEYPEARRLVDERGGMLSPGEAGRRVAAVVAAAIAHGWQPEAMVAAGGLCAPLMPFYGVETVGDTRRPVRDEALVSFQATRGGLISMAPPLLPALEGSVSQWTIADDVAALSNDGSPSDVKKAILRVECGDERTSRIYAVVTRLLMGEILNRTFGEWTNAWSDLALVAHARRAETLLLAGIKVNSTVVNLETTRVSATRDTLNTLARLAAGIRSRRRIARTYPFRVILPEVWLDVAREDIANAMPGVSIDDNLAIAEARILNYFRTRNLNVTWSPDLDPMTTEQAAGTVIHDLPNQVDFALYPEGTHLFLDNGTIDLGVVRDTTTAEVNDFQTFTESFEGTHKLGNDSYWGTLNVCPSGAANGTLDPEAMCASYT